MAKSKSTLAALLVCAMALGLISCLSGRESLAADVDPAGWDSEVKWLYDNRDTLTHKDISFSLRYNADAVASKGVYIIESITPSGGHIEDALHVTIDPQGDNNLHETSFVFRTNARFSEVGKYSFTIVPLQRTVGVWSVSMELKPTEAGETSSGRQGNNK
jgi:hypothetical protein